MQKITHENFLELFLKGLKDRYNTDTKREALMAYFEDFVQDMAAEADRQGKTREEFTEEMIQEMRRFELKRLKDPEMSSCYHKILMMFDDWNGKD